MCWEVIAKRKDFLVCFCCCFFFFFFFFFFFCGVLGFVSFDAGLQI